MSPEAADKLIQMGILPGSTTWEACENATLAVWQPVYDEVAQMKGHCPPEVAVALSKATA